jgi:hypothetical protein
LRRTKGASIAAASADQEEAFRIFESLLRDHAKGKGSNPAPDDLVHFRYGEVLLMAGRHQRAIEEFRAAGQTGAEPGLITMARLRVAHSMDLSGRRREALAEYGAVLARPRFQRSYEEARRGLREPYRMTDLSQE